MSTFQSFSMGLRTTKPLPDGCRASLDISPSALMRSGFNIPVAISLASMLRDANPGKGAEPVVIMAHFDTGASKTCIDFQIAELLGLSPIGASESMTAKGPTTTPDYVVDISFPGTELKPFQNIQVGSCQLPFEKGDGERPPVTKSNMGVLIGRDIMARWNIVWNGPSSTVFISD